MPAMFKKFPQPVNFILLCYLCSLFIFFSLRLLLFLLNFHLAAEIPSAIILKSFLIGAGFDTAIICYLLSLPFVSYLVLSFRKDRSDLHDNIVFLFLVVAFALCFFIACSDLPWFEHQQKRITVSALQWTGTPGIMFGVIFEDKRNYPYLFLFAFLVFSFYFLLKKIKKSALAARRKQNNILFSSLIYLTIALLLFFGIRGRITFKSPLRWGSAFVSEYDFTNQLGLNPVFTFAQSWIDQRDPHNQKMHFMDDDQAVLLVKKYYKTDIDTSYSPVARKIITNGNPKKFNIILVLMESMTAYNMQAFGNQEKLTPVLDSLYYNSLSFSNFYSDGIHTFCGLYSSLFGMPSTPGRHHMKDLKNQQPYGGLAKTLESKNYHTIFLTTHDEQFDNMGGFLAPNGFQTIISQKDYNRKNILNTLGVPDHILFEEAVNHLNTLNKSTQLFFATILTASNHGPYEIPEGIPFAPRSSDIRKQLVEYADWSIGSFIKSCRQQAWFDSTIFIFTGDHGAIIGDMDMYLTFHHVPCIVYAPKIISPKIEENLSGQVDIFPMVMGLLNQPYTNNSFGIDPLREKRDFITFSYDDEFGTFSSHDFFINRNVNPALYQMNNEARYCKIISNTPRADSMFSYSKAVFQTHQWMIENHKMY